LYLLPINCTLGTIHLYHSTELSLQSFPCVRTTICCSAMEHLQI